MIADDATSEPNDRHVRLDARKWLMRKVFYPRYGDKLVHSGDPENPIQVMHRGAGIADMHPHELVASAHWRRRCRRRLSTMMLSQSNICRIDQRRYRGDARL